jgi:ubiquinone/menaquinone biosynthesis C-methylase UbiE
MTIDPNNPYTKIQQTKYDEAADKWSLSAKDHVVGWFDGHNAWEHYEELFNGIETEEKVALDFGCGPGRNLVRYCSRFDRIDGADISQINLDKARLWINHNSIPLSDGFALWKVNGVDLQPIESNYYDIVFSTIAIQHIPVYDIRFNLFSEMYRVLDTNGWLTVQMGYGPDRPGAVDYYDNKWDASDTNGFCDVKITHPLQLKIDLMEIGFTNFSHTITPVGPGDLHTNWIFFRAQK